MSAPPILDAAEAQKRAAAEAAVAEVEAGMLVGLGTGSTAAYAVAALGERVRHGLSITAVATSRGTNEAAVAAGIRTLSRPDGCAIDLAIDGVDEIDDELRAIKGAGGAMLREKIVAAAARRLIAVADASKQVMRLGGRPVPAEVLPFAEATVARAVVALGGDAVTRMDGGVPWRSDQDNLVLDCRFAKIPDPMELAGALSAIPGLLGHGLFVTEIDTLLLGAPDGVLRRDRPAVR